MYSMSDIIRPSEAWTKFLKDYSTQSKYLVVLTGKHF